MQFLLEGADGTGKTTLAGALQQKYSAKYRHFSVPDEHPIAYWMKNGLGEYPGGSNNVVIDRLHLSEEAYGTVYRGGSGLTDHQFWLLEGWLWARNTVLVMCEAEWADMQANQEKAESQIYHDDKQEAVAEQFRSLVHKTSLPLIFYNYKADDLKLRRARVGPSRYASIEYFMGLDGRINYVDDGIGSLNPQMWLVGDRSNPLEWAISDQFRVAFQGSAGDFLRRGLAGAMEWSAVHISNSRDENGALRDLAGKWGSLGTPLIVALGVDAHKALEIAGLDHGRAPARWQHFQGDLEAYGKLILGQVRAQHGVNAGERKKVGLPT